MRTSVFVILAACGVVLASATVYDASTLTRWLGLPLEGGEGIVASASLALSVGLVLWGAVGLLRRSRADAHAS